MSPIPRSRSYSSTTICHQHQPWAVPVAAIPGPGPGPGSAEAEATIPAPLNHKLKVFNGFERTRKVIIIINGCKISYHPIVCDPGGIPWVAGMFSRHHCCDIFSGFGVAENRPRAWRVRQNRCLPCSRAPSWRSQSCFCTCPRGRSIPRRPPRRLHEPPRIPWPTLGLCLRPWLPRQSNPFTPTSIRL